MAKFGKIIERGQMELFTVPAEPTSREVATLRPAIPASGITGEQLLGLAAEQDYALAHLAWCKAWNAGIRGATEQELWDARARAWETVITAIHG